MTKLKNTKQKQPQVTYQFVDDESENNDGLNRAFDILFEEVLKETGDLTAIDN